MWSIILDVLCAWNVVFALTLLIISVMTYLRAGKSKFLLITLVFLLFFAKGVLATINLFSASETTLGTNLAVLLDCTILVILFFAIIKR
jgi:hypothetical protein